VVNTTTQQYTFIGDNTGYYYRVRMNEAGSLYSAPRRTQFTQRNHELMVSADVGIAGARADVTLSWLNLYDVNQNPTTTQYKIYRRDAFGSSGTDFGNPIATFTAAEEGVDWVDNDVPAGVTYDYKIVRTGAEPGESRIVVAAGIDESAHEQRGSIVLLVDDRFVDSLALEIERLRADLVGDGWNVIPQYVDIATATPADLQSDIRAYYQANKNIPSKVVRSVLLLGHLPVVRSGWQDPSTHGYAAAVADTFYGDVDGDWTDSVDFRQYDPSPSASQGELQNIPGDGIYDHGASLGQGGGIVPLAPGASIGVPEDADGLAQELSVGRVDMFGMGLLDPKSSYDALNTWQTFRIEIGKHYIGTHELSQGRVLFDSLSFVAGDNLFNNDSNLVQLGGDGNTSKFRGLKLRNKATGHEITIDFQDDLQFAAAREELGDELRRGKDQGQNDVSYENEELVMASNKNNWKIAGLKVNHTLDDRYPTIYEEFVENGKFKITADTELSIDFYSSGLPDVVAVGFDQQDTQISGQEVLKESDTFRIHANIGSPWGREIDPNLETKLLRQYLYKDHLYRHGELGVSNRALVDDVDAIQTTLENAFGMFPVQNVDVQYNSTYNWTDIDWDQYSALWGFGGGSGNTWNNGQYNTENDVEVLFSHWLKDHTSNAVFNQMYMSWGGNWERSDSLLRSIIADEGQGLVSFYGSVDALAMGAGHTVGTAYLKTQNIGDNANSISPSRTYRSIIGDPTLRLHIVPSPSTVHAAQSGSNVVVSWEASDISSEYLAEYPGQFLGYHVYKLNSATGLYERTTTTPTTSTSYSVLNASASDVYMIRAVKREDVNSGSYVNLSQGAFSTTAPSVTNVTINSSAGGNYSNIPYEFDGVVGSGKQLSTVPVGAANIISVQFTEDVEISLGDLDLIALNRFLTEPVPTGFDPPTATNNYTATWTLPSALPSAQYLLRLSDTIVDAGGNQLDGEWTNPGSLSSTGTSVFPSGDYVEGGDFEFVFTILPGDMNRDNRVNNLDISLFSSAVNNPSSVPAAIAGLADINLDGSVNSSDNSPFANALNGPAITDLAIVANMDDDFDVDDDDDVLFSNYWVVDDPRADLDNDSDVDFDDIDVFAKYYYFGIDLDIL
jgi:hypothetical protein